MEIAVIEVAALESAADKNIDEKLRELQALELMVIGGGQGDICLG